MSPLRRMLGPASSTQPRAASPLNTTVLETLASEQRRTRRRQRTLQQASALAVAVLLLAGAGKAHFFEPPTPAQTLASTAVATASTRLTPHGPAVPVSFEGLVGPASVRPAEPAQPERSLTPTRIRRAERFDPAAFANVAGTILEEGIASFYGEAFAGRPTANGETFDPEGLTAAHRTLPLGSIIRVTNLRNGQSVVVRVNDRGPYAGDRVLDLSHGAAKAIDMARRGTARIRIEVL